MNPVKGQFQQRKEKKLTKVISEYYLKSDPTNEGSLVIYNIKDFGSGYWVLTEKYSGEGEKFSLLLLVDYDFNILAKASGNTPLSSCFSANVLKYLGKVQKTIIIILFTTATCGDEFFFCCGC